jgi:hypothetical protein
MWTPGGSEVVGGYRTAAHENADDMSLLSRWNRRNQRAVTRASGPTGEEYRLDFEWSRQDVSEVRGPLKRLLARWRCSDARAHV